MAKATVAVDMTEVTDVLQEIGRLAAGITSIPFHIERRLHRLDEADELEDIRGWSRVVFEGGRFRAEPGPELLCLLVDLRVLAGVRP